MSNRFIRIFSFFILLVILDFSGITVFALTNPVADSSQVVVRQLDSHFIDVYRSQKEFNYTLPPPETNFLQRLWIYLEHHFGGWEDFLVTMPLIFKILFGGLTIFLLFIAITTTRIYKLFYSDPEIASPEVSFVNRDYQPIDFDEAIFENVSKMQYRLAIRLFYLKIINALRLKDYIHFSKEKTNIDYLLDLTNDDLKSGFHSITTIYNHVWYGELEISQEQYLRFETNFQSFYTTIDVEN